MIRIGINAKSRLSISLSLSLCSLLLVSAVAASANTTDSMDQATDLHSELKSRTSALEQELNQLSSELHPTDLLLAEPHMDLAHANQSLGNHAEAINGFEKALHIYRINHGLFDLRQLTVVENLLVSHYALGRWEDIDNLQHLRFHLAKQQIPPGAETRLSALMGLTMWKLQAAENDLLANPLAAAHEVAELHRKELELLPADAPADSLAMHHLGIADMELTLARQKVRAPFAMGLDSGMPLTTLGLHGNIRLVDDSSSSSLVESFDQLPNTGKERLDVFHISRHLHEYKSSLSKAHSLSRRAAEHSPHHHEVLEQSIKRSIDNYNGFVAKVVLGRF